MPVKMWARVEGLAEVRAGLREIGGDNAQRACVSATAAAAQVIKKRWQGFYRRNPSVDTGLLVRSVIAKKVPRSQTQLTSEHIVTVRKRDYPAQRGKARRNTKQVAIYLEFGTVKMPAEPAGRPAYDTGKEAATQAMVDRLKRRISKFRSATA